MNNLKFGVLACGLIGLIACFLPMMSFGDQSVSLWKLREVPGGSGQVFITMAGYIAAVAMGGMAAAKPPMQRWQAIVSCLGFALVFIKLREGFFKLITDGAIGAKLMAISVLAGIVISILCIAKPEQAK